MKFGAPFEPPIFLPLLSRITPLSKMPPAAFSTPGTCCTCATYDAGNAGGLALLSEVKIFFGGAVTSTPFLPFAEIWSNWWFIVLVRGWEAAVGATTGA